MGRIFHQEVNCRTLHYYSTRGPRSRCLIVTTLCAVCMLQFSSEAGAQCTARDVLQNHVKLKKAPSTRAPQVLVTSATEVAVWKTIMLGTFADSFALRNALDAKGCNVGDLAEEVLARPDFIISSTKADVELVAITAAELGFKTDTVTLAAIYARARQLGFRTAEAEVGPQLRLQYFDQPIGESLIIGMEPIKRWSGEPVILNVFNGGAGLILIGQDGRPDAKISVVSRFLFVRPVEAVPAGELETAAAFPPGVGFKKKSRGAPEH